MAKKKNKNQMIADAHEETITPNPVPAAASTSKAKDAKTTQPSTSALIICRNK